MNKKAKEVEVKEMIEEFGLGDIAVCPHCGKEFELNNLDEDELNDFDNYFEHVTMCG